MTQYFLMAVLGLLTCMGACARLAEMSRLEPTEETRMPVTYEYSCANARLLGGTCRASWTSTYPAHRQ